MGGACGRDVQAGQDGGGRHGRQQEPEEQGDLARQVVRAGKAFGHHPDTGPGGHDHAADRFLVGVREHLPPRLGLPEEAGHQLRPVGPGGAELAARLGVDRDPQGRAEHRLTGQPVGQQQQGVGEFLQLEYVRADAFGGDGRGQDPARQVALGGEVEVQGPLGDFGPIQDLGDGRRLVAVLVERRGRGLQDDLPGADRPLLLCHNHSSPRAVPSP
ncbi:hypothetical protein BN2537_963 [Streptomyces venezuelae]|nr:hypothetical protein BN2537_963 [Streptomyces venezuelae]